MNNLVGIYYIRNTINNKIYVGSAYNILKRIYNHKYNLDKNNHKNKHLQFSWNKYGSDKFIFYVLETVDNKKLLLKKEQYWIDILCAMDIETYNIAIVAGSNTGITHSLVSKNIISVKAKRRIEENPNYISNLTKKRRLWAASDEGKLIQSQGQKRRYESQVERNLASKRTKDFFALPASRNNTSMKKRKKDREGNPIIYNLQSPDGEVYLDIPVIKVFCIEHGIGIAGIGALLRGEVKGNHYKGWTVYIPEGVL